jgi:DNA (cytosine-5)-methyltransferase 1
MTEDLPNIAYTLKAEGDRIHADGSDNLVIAATLSSGSNPNSSAAGRRREDDVNLVVISQQNGSAHSGDQVGTIQTNGDNRGWAVRTGKMLRRLSPLECERVQGYPDAWTCLCGKGLGRSLYGCKCPDSPRYHALGNSISIPPVEWIARRIMKARTADL